MREGFFSLLSSPGARQCKWKYYSLLTKRKFLVLFFSMLTRRQTRRSYCFSGGSCSSFSFCTHKRRTACHLFSPSSAPFAALLTHLPQQQSNRTYRNSNNESSFNPAEAKQTLYDIININHKSSPHELHTYTLHVYITLQYIIKSGSLRINSCQISLRYLGFNIACFSEWEALCIS